MEEYDRILLSQAISLAKHSIEVGSGGPFGAVIAINGKIVGRGVNRVYSRQDPTAHAEIEAIRDACQNLNAGKLSGTTLYTSCEPCPMCYAAAHWAGIDRIIYAASHRAAGDISGFSVEKMYEQLSIPPLEREIQHLQAMEKEGEKIFHEWEKKKPNGSSKQAADDKNIDFFT